jgi:hypothetical protein
MNRYETYSHVSSDGSLLIRGLPPEFARRDVRVRIELFNSQSANRTEALARLGGAIDDPTFVRHPQEPPTCPRDSNL